MVHTKNHVTSVPDLHSVSWDTFDKLAVGAGGTSTGSVLRSADRSRRLLLLSGLVNLAEADKGVTGPLASVETAWDLLVRAEETKPDALERVITHPYTGSWAGYTTRLTEQELTGECPLWV